MPTFKFNLEQPYYQERRLVKKVKTQQTISLSATDCTIGLDCGTFNTADRRARPVKRLTSGFHCMEAWVYIIQSKSSARSSAGTQRMLSN